VTYRRTARPCTSWWPFSVAAASRTALRIRCTGWARRVKLAHAVAGLFVNAYRAGGRSLPEPVDDGLAALLDSDADDSSERHAAIGASASALARRLVQKAGDGVGLDAIGTLGDRAGSLLLAGALHAPYLATAHHHAGARAALHELETAFFGLRTGPREPRALVFSATFEEANGVAGTMRRLAQEAARGRLAAKVVIARALPTHSARC